MVIDLLLTPSLTFPMPHFIIYSRSYCHLCEDMLSALEQYRHTYEFTVEIVDVDADEALVALYDELVPVLMGSHTKGESRQLCHYFLDRELIEHFLQQQD